MAVNYTDVQKTEKYISRTNFDALEMAAVPEGTEFNIVDQIHESDLDSDVLQKLNNNAKINTANTFTAAQTFKKDITIEGNIIQNGSAYETHAEKLYTKNDMIFTRDGATAALADNAYTGIQAVKYDGTNDGQLVFGKDGVARVGDIGNTQPLATRAEAGALTDGHVLQWDAAGQTLIDSGKSVSDLEGGGGDVTAAGNNTFTGSNWFKGNGAIITTQNGIRIGFSNGLSPDTDSSIYSIDKYGFYGLGKNGGLQTIKFPDLSTFSTATHTIPLSDTNNTFTGTNLFKGGTTQFLTSSAGLNDPKTDIGAYGILCQTGGNVGTYYKDGKITNGTNTLTLPSKTGTVALTSDIPSTSNFVTLSGAQTISGNKTFNNHIILPNGPDGYIEFGNWRFFGYSLSNNVTSTSLSFPSGKNGTIALTGDIPIKSATLSDNDTTLTLVLK